MSKTSEPQIYNDLNKGQPTKLEKVFMCHTYSKMQISEYRNITKVSKNKK